MWIKTLAEQGIRDRHVIECGLYVAREQTWGGRPSAGRFCQWAWTRARAQAGIPTLQEAKAQVFAKVRNPQIELSGAMYHLWLEMDTFAAKRASSERLADMAEQAHKAMLEHWKAGKPFKQPIHKPASELLAYDNRPKPLTAQQREHGKAQMQKLRALFG